MTPRQFIRKILAEHPDGLSISDIAEAYGQSTRRPYKQVRSSIEGALKSQYKTAYIDRYEVMRVRHHDRLTSYRWVAVWCLIEWPEDAPRPTTKAGEHVR